MVVSLSGLKNQQLNIAYKNLINLLFMEELNFVLNLYR